MAVSQIQPVATAAIVFLDRTDTIQLPAATRQQGVLESQSQKYLLLGLFQKTSANSCLAPRKALQTVKKPW